MFKPRLRRGRGKVYFIQNLSIHQIVFNIVTLTTREFEEGEMDGIEPTPRPRRGRAMERSGGGGWTGVNRTTADGYAGSRNNLENVLA